MVLVDISKRVGVSINRYLHSPKYHKQKDCDLNLEQIFEGVKVALIKHYLKFYFRDDPKTQQHRITFYGGLNANTVDHIVHTMLKAGKSCAFRVGESFARS